MVFATEFDPNNQSARARTSLPQTASARSIKSDISTAAKGHDAADKVIPLQPSLQLGTPAVRVRLDNSKSLPLSQPKLSWSLQLITRLQQGSTILTSLLVTGALVVYGSTVYVDKSTHRALLQLDSLQGESQQLTSANESIKESLAEQAIQPDSGLEPYEAGDVLFLTPEPVREELEQPEAATEMPGPLGY